MSIEPIELDGARALRLDGRLDGAWTQAFGGRLVELLGEADAPHTLDLSRVTYISSAGLRAIFQAARKLQERGVRLTLARVPPTVAATLTLSGFSTFLTLCPIEEAPHGDR